MVVPNGTLVTAKQFFIHDKNYGVSNTSGTYGWSVFSPWSKNKYIQYGLSYDEHILLKDNVYMLTSDKSFADELNEYYLSEGLIAEDYVILDTKAIAYDRMLLLFKWNNNLLLILV